MTLLDSPMSIGTHCAGLFIDINNDLYCAQDDRQQVLKKSLNDPSKANIIAAGTGCAGSASHMLNAPNGIFVTENLNLYLADSGNDRIQLFRSEELNGTTVAGNGSIGTIALSGPAGVALDADGYLFIVDSGNSRIVGSGPYGFRCVVGCSGSFGPSATQLNNPGSLSFDIGGNMLVTDQGNSRIQKFLLVDNTSGKLRESRRQRGCVAEHFCSGVLDSMTKIRFPSLSVD